MRFAKSLSARRDRLGRALTGAILMVSQQSEPAHRYHLSRDGPLGNLFAEASYEGEARGYCSNGQAQLPLKNGHLDVSGGIGRGVLAVVRSLPFQKEPHSGIVPILSGEVSEDLAYYLFQSHQIPSISFARGFARQVRRGSGGGRGPHRGDAGSDGFADFHSRDARSYGELTLAAHSFGGEPCRVGESVCA